mmetsp:Transcript_17171/g.23865  ORF Transcript_17171/g.23865 Transcript_17171/m.23865 type:complete len:434 (-) Transcript_17171:20-1321(-)
MEGRILSVDYVEFWCSNAKILSKHYCHALGFLPLALKGLETGDKQFCSRVVGQHDLKFVFTSSLRPFHLKNYKSKLQEIQNSTQSTPQKLEDDQSEYFCEQQAKHGDHIHDIAFRVTNVQSLYRQALSNGGISIESPHEITDKDGTVVIAKIGNPFSDIVHTLIDRTNYRGVFLPGYRSLHTSATITAPITTSMNTNSQHEEDVGLSHIDHIALAYPKGSVQTVLNWYSECLGFEQYLCSDEDTEEGLTVMGTDGGLKTMVAKVKNPQAHDDLCFKFVFVESLDFHGKRSNQVEEFLEYNGGSGVQHIAVHSHDIVTTVSHMRDCGVELITVPSTYYDTLFQSPAAQFLLNQRESLEKLGILVEIPNSTSSEPNKPVKHMMQTFTHPLEDRPTFFLEVISRKGSAGFGRKTIKALFEAVEKLQEMRSPEAQEN